MRERDLLTPEAVARVKHLEFFARTRVEGFLTGANRSRMKGVSPEFLQHRKYMPGDDLRRLDWRVFGRTNRLVTREFEEFTNLDVVLALDFSGSMGYGLTPMSKMDFALHCAALLAYLLHLRHDRFALAACTDVVGSYLPLGSGRKHLAAIFRQLASLPIDGETRLERCATQLLQRLKRRSSIVIFSDCYEDPEPLTSAVGQLALRGHDVILYQVVHESEKELNFTGFTLFRDLETGQIDAADPLEIAAAYRDVVAEHRRELETGAARFGVEFRQVTVTEHWDFVLAALLDARKSL